MRFIASILLSMFIALAVGLIGNGFDLRGAQVAMMFTYAASMFLLLERQKAKEVKR